MRRLGRWLIALVLAVVPPFRSHRDEERIVPPRSADRRAENITVALLFAAALCAVAFVVLYALDGLGNRTQLFGIALGLSFGFIAAALIVLGKRLVVTEELAEDYPQPEHPDEQNQLVELVEESGDGITRKRLMLVAGGAAGTALGAAALTPALSLGPLFDTAGLRETPWQRGRRLVDFDGRPYRAADISIGSFYTAFPEGAKQDKIGSPLAVVRIDPAELQLPPERATWAPEGILAFSKICTHAGCAVSEYRHSQFAPTTPSPALVCPCHYSTFEPATGGSVVFGPAGRPLPQLPLLIDGGGHLRAAGGYSGPVGPGWSGVRESGT